MSSERSECLETIDDLTSVRGGFDAGRCFDDVWPWAASGAVGFAAGPWTGVGTMAAGGAAAAMTSANCGDGQRSPATMLRQGISDSLGGGNAQSGDSGSDGMQ
jgi:hypothetical protein